MNTVFQSYALFPHLTVAQNIGFGLEMLGKPKDEIKKTVGEMMELVKMSQMADRQTGQISWPATASPSPVPRPTPQGFVVGRTAERAGFQAAQGHAAGVEAVADGNRHHLYLRDSRSGRSIDHVRPDRGDESGTIRQIGGPRDIYDRPAERFVADFIGDTNFVPAQIAANTGNDAQVTLSSGKTVTAKMPEGTALTGKVTWPCAPSTPVSAQRPRGCCPAGFRKSSISARTLIFTWHWMMGPALWCAARTGQTRRCRSAPATASASISRPVSVRF